MKIRQHIVRVFAALAICMLAFAGNGDVLWWLVDDSANVDGQSIYSFVSSYGVEPDETGYNWYNVGARLRLTNPDGSTDIIPIANSALPDERFEFLDFFDGGGQNGGGFGTGTWSGQSILHESPIYKSELLTEAMFQIELGYLSYNDAIDIVGFETIAKSETVIGSQIMDAIFWGGVNTPADIQWTPTVFHTIPEPSSSIMLIFGVSVLLLMRKQRMSRMP